MVQGEGVQVPGVGEGREGGGQGAPSKHISVGLSPLAGIDIKRSGYHTATIHILFHIVHHG